MKQPALTKPLEAMLDRRYVLTIETERDLNRRMRLMPGFDRG